MSNVEVSRTAQRDTGQIKLHGADAFAGMRKAGQLAAEALDMLVPCGQAGRHHRGARRPGAANSRSITTRSRPPLNYRGYPKSICTSINHVVCHGIPGPKPLREGDIVNIDVTLILDGWHGDTSRMYAVGGISRRAERLIEVTYEALMRGIAAVKPGHTTGHIGAAIQSYAESRALQRGARLLRPRARPRVPRPPQHPALRRARRRSGAEARHAVHHRADDQPRQAGT